MKNQKNNFTKNPLYADNFIRTVSGIYINVFEIEKHINDIKIEDIAHALSLQCRFSGHLKTFYSVAEHSIHVAKIVDNEHKLAALLHDASEAYLVDIPTPIKCELSQYKELEFNVMNTIARKFDFQFPFSKEVKRADNEVLEFEWEKFMLNGDMLIRPFKEVKKEFIKKFNLYKNLKRQYYDPS